MSATVSGNLVSWRYGLITSVFPRASPLAGRRERERLPVVAPLVQVPRELLDRRALREPLETGDEMLGDPRRALVVAIAGECIQHRLEVNRLWSREISYSHRSSSNRSSAGKRTAPALRASPR